MQPSWEPRFAGFARGFVRKNYWRVRHYFPSQEDAVQECAYWFAKLLQKYQQPPTWVTHDREGERWLMGLFQATLYKQWCRYSRNDVKRRHLSYESDYSDEAWQNISQRQEQTTASMGPLSSAVANASSELREALAILAGAPAEVLQWLYQKDVGGSVDLEGLDERMAALTGRHGVMKQLHALARGEEAEIGGTYRLPRRKSTAKVSV